MESMSDDNPLLTTPPSPRVKHLFQYEKSTGDGDVIITCYCRTTRPKKYVPLDHFGTALPEDVTRVIDNTTCPDCICAWETEPMPVTTQDLLALTTLVGDFVSLTQQLVAQSKMSYTVALSRIRVELRKIEDRLQRPRRKP
jgi:hypothetical protein